MISRARVLWLACVCAADLTGCGQRGPLYLPDETPAGTAAQTPAQSPAQGPDITGAPQAAEATGAGAENQANTPAANDADNANHAEEDDAER
jgi:predicted small lipoprotein YifL